MYLILPFVNPGKEKSKNLFCLQTNIFILNAAEIQTTLSLGKNNTKILNRIENGRRKIVVKSPQLEKVVWAIFILLFFFSSAHFKTMMPKKSYTKYENIRYTIFCIRNSTSIWSPQLLLQASTKFNKIGVQQFLTSVN